MMPPESEKPNPEPATELNGEEDVESLRQELDEARDKAEGYLANWQRIQADFINYKRRQEQEKEDLGKYAKAGLMLNLLPVLDDLERALESVPARSARLSWVDGIRLIERKFRASLEAQGLTAIEALDKPFDPNFHEAVRQDRGQEGIVVAEVQRGYTLNDKVIRPAMVVVGYGEEAAKEER
jgi:molecular chaperone GrpE